MANVDPNKVLAHMAQKLAEAQLDASIASVALEDANAQIDSLINALAEERGKNEPVEGDVVSDPSGQ